MTLRCLCLLCIVMVLVTTMSPVPMLLLGKVGLFGACIGIIGKVVVASL